MGLMQNDVRAGVVELKQIDIVGPQPAQAALQRRA